MKTEAEVRELLEIQRGALLATVEDIHNSITRGNDPSSVLRGGRIVAALAQQVADLSWILEEPEEA